MSERCKQTSEQMSEWPCTLVPIFAFSEPMCVGQSLNSCCLGLSGTEKNTGFFKVPNLTEWRHQMRSDSLLAYLSLNCTVVQNNQESRCKYWATRWSVHLFTHTAHSFSCSALLALLTRFACALRCAHLFTCLLACSFRSLSHSWESE